MEIAKRTSSGLIKLALSVLVAASTASAQTPGQPAGPIPVESFFRNADIGAAKLSPSGRWLAVTTGVGVSRVGLAVVDLEGKVPPQQAARFDDLDIRSFHWVNDGRLAFDVVDLQMGSGDQRVTPGLFSVRPDGSELRMLIKLGRPFLSDSRTAVREPLEWNHTLLMIPNGGGDQAIIGELKSDSRGELQAMNALRLDVATGRASSLSVGAPPNAKAWLFDPKGEPRVVVATKDGLMRIHWRAPGQDKWVELAHFDSFSPGFVPSFVDGSGDLYVTTSEGSSGTAVLKRFDLTTGRPQADALVSAPGFDFTGEFIVDRASGKATGVQVETDAVTTVWFDPRMKALQQAVDSRLPGLINQIDCSRCTSPDAVVLVHAYSDRDPGQYWVYWPERERWQMVGQAHKDIDPRQMATLDLHRIKARDGLDLPVWITTPKVPSTSPRPAVVLVHGGPWIRGSHWQWEPTAQFLASRGYLVIEPEFRGSSGFGDKHFKAGWKQWGLSMQDDVADGLLWAVSKGWVDPKRVCIAGASYGGYATLMGLVRHPELYRCGVAWAAVTDPRLLYELDWISDLPEEYKNFGLPAMLGDPVKDAAALKAVAPVEQAARIKAPLLLAFGLLDRRVPIEHGRHMRDALHEAGRDVEWVTYATEGHGWLILENRVDFAKRLEAFLARNLK
jgi:dipeptidyl aminopeptidase/acylaminoacyl peptidase